MAAPSEIYFQTCQCVEGKTVLPENVYKREKWSRFNILDFGFWQKDFSKIYA